jgi:diaminopimelate decarboxylase
VGRRQKVLVGVTEGATAAEVARRIIRQPALELVGVHSRIWSQQECAARGIPLPRLTVEPGRAIVGPAGVTLYRVLSVKHGARTSVVVDGYLCDSAQAARRGSRHDIVPIGYPAGSKTEPMTVVGRYCDAADTFATEALLPGEICPGDLLAAVCTGAREFAMASNYHHVARPPVIAVREGRAWPLIRRETDEDLLRREGA